MSLTYESASRLYEYDKQNGGLLWKADRHCGRGRVVAKAGTKPGGVNKGRRLVWVDGKQYFEHRVVWLLVNGALPNQEIDHVDGNPLNNRIENLRDVSPAVNRENQRQARSDSSSKLLGAHWNSQFNKWQSRIRAGGKLMHLGYFSEPVDAHAAYVEAKRRLHAGCTI